MAIYLFIAQQAWRHGDIHPCWEHGPTDRHTPVPPLCRSPLLRATCSHGSEGPHRPTHQCTRLALNPTFLPALQSSLLDSHNISPLVCSPHFSFLPMSRTPSLLFLPPSLASLPSHACIPHPSSILSPYKPRPSLSQSRRTKDQTTDFCRIRWGEQKRTFMRK